MNLINIPKSTLITKADICICLGYKSMKPIYDKILNEKTIKNIGFKSIEEFKKIKKFDLYQTRDIKKFLTELKNEMEK